VANAIPGGLPTFYLVFDDAAGITLADNDGVAGGALVRTASAVTILAVRQDRHVTDPAFWTAQLAVAIGAGGGDASSWQPFATAVANAIATGNSAPVMLYNHAGQPLRTASVDIVL